MAYQELIISHYESVWNNQPKIYLFDKGPIEKMPHDFRILEFKSTSKRNMWTYATCCMSQPEDISKIELHIFSSKKDDTLIELLTVAAFYHRNTKALDLNHTVNFGRSWQNNSSCTHGFISLPYLDGPDLENMNETKFYWLLPITFGELKFKIEKGSEALEKLFETNLFDYVDANRKSLI